MSHLNLYSTPKVSKKRTRTANLTFNKKNTHHDLYDILTYNIPNFYNYLIDNLETELNQNRENIYINIKQKAYSYNGKNTNSNKGEYIIEFINNNKMITSNFYKYFKDVHFTLHKYSNRSNKLHFTYVDLKNKVFNLELKYNNEENEIEEKEMKNQKQFIFQNKYQNILNTTRIIIKIMNNFIKEVIIQKKNNCSKNKLKLPKHFDNHEFPSLNELNELNELDKLQSGGYKNLKKNELIQVCKLKNISGYSKLKKDELIKLLKRNKI